MGYAWPQAVTYQFECIKCANCMMPFWVPEDWKKQRQNDRGTFYCPNGHSMSYTEGESERLRKMLNQANAMNSALAAKLTGAQTERDKLERKLKRVERGVCPHCNRSFQNLARHMCSKHGEKS